MLVLAALVVPGKAEELVVGNQQFAGLGEWRCCCAQQLYRCRLVRCVVMLLEWWDVAPSEATLEPPSEVALEPPSEVARRPSVLKVLLALV